MQGWNLPVHSAECLSVQAADIILFNPWCCMHQNTTRISINYQQDSSIWLVLYWHNYFKSCYHHVPCMSMSSSLYFWLIHSTLQQNGWELPPFILPGCFQVVGSPMKANRVSRIVAMTDSAWMSVADCVALSRTWGGGNKQIEVPPLGSLPYKAKYGSHLQWVICKNLYEKMVSPRERWNTNKQNNQPNKPTNKIMVGEVDAFMLLCRSVEREMVCVLLNQVVMEDGGYFDAGFQRFRGAPCNIPYFFDLCST